jgi:hypothetical protein
LTHLLFVVTLTVITKQLHQAVQEALDADEPQGGCHPGHARLGEPESLLLMLMSLL